MKEPQVKMIEVNRRQAAFYDAIQSSGDDYSRNRQANLATRFIARLRYLQQDSVRASGIRQRVHETQRAWIREKAGGLFLEIGCFTGSDLTFDLVDQAARYVGVELSPRAAEALNGKFAERGVAEKAEARAVDFLAFDFPERFDLIYAHGVLHHFEYPDVLFEKIHSLAKPDARLVFQEPSAVNQLYALVRRLYRPFQSDSEWEWPFSDATLTALEEHFEAVAGYGWGRRSLPLSVLISLPVLSRVLRGTYKRMIDREVGEGWHEDVWDNSIVVANYRPRERPVRRDDAPATHV